MKMNDVSRSIISTLVNANGFPVHVDKLMNEAGKSNISKASRQVYVSLARKKLYPGERIVACGGRRYRYEQEV